MMKKVDSEEQPTTWQEDQRRFEEEDSDEQPQPQPDSLVVQEWDRVCELLVGKSTVALGEIPKLIEALLADRRRLAYMIQHPVAVVEALPEHRWYIMLLPDQRMIGKLHDTPRSAIDAARGSSDD